MLGYDNGNVDNESLLQQIPAVVVTMGTKDGNRGEIKQLRETQGDRLQVFEFEGGHQWAPKAIVEKALDYVHAKLPK